MPFHDSGQAGAKPLTTNTKGTVGVTTVRHFSGQRQSAHKPFETVASEESQAALRQMSLERLMAYGVHHADAMELRGRVWSGETWQSVAYDLAETCLSRAGPTVAPETPQTSANRLFRASALVRMSQMMMVGNSAERSAIVRRAGQLYEEASALVADRERILFETPNGLLTAWMHHSKASKAVGWVVVIGGIEGWAMDFGEMGNALAERGVNAVALDGPGQGESRMVHGHFLNLGWEAAYAAVFDALQRSNPSLPIGFIGNSMGGAVGMHLARIDRRIAAFCDNGGGPKPARPRSSTTFAQKMAAHVGDVSIEASTEVWRSIVPIDPDLPVRCPLLVVHGALDPVVSTEDAKAMFDSGVSDDKHLVIFDDGDHCIYNHADDKHALIGDWIVSRLANAQ